MNPSLPYDVLDVRRTPICPTSEDINRSTPPNIRENLIGKPYKNVQEYVETQFMLLRETINRPLIEEIEHYRHWIKKNKSKTNGKGNSEPSDSREFLNEGSLLKVRTGSKESTIYTGIELNSCEITNSGILVAAKLNPKGLEKINWADTSSLMSGSLICLSCDDFKTMFFATIAKREPEDILSTGTFYLSLVDFDWSILLDKKTYVAVESKAYFETYKHCMKVLQNLNEDNLPFKRYIIKLRDDIEAPKYLRQHGQNPKYDLSFLAFPFNREKKGQLSALEKIGKSIDAATLKSVEILQPCSSIAWDMSELDKHQFVAYHAALTKELTLIQGPPGTGKTYIASRIIQTFLANERHIYYDRQPPILILSFKNHALDQFLSRISVITDSIVRIGGRDHSKLIEKYALHNLRQEAFDSKLFEKSDVGKNLQKQKKLCFNTMRSIFTKFDKIASKFRMISMGNDVATFHTLPFVGQSHLDQLLGSKLCDQVTQCLKEKDPLVHLEYYRKEIESAFVKWLNPDIHAKFPDILDKYLSSEEIDEVQTFEKSQQQAEVEKEKDQDEKTVQAKSNEDNGDLEDIAPENAVELVDVMGAPTGMHIQGQREIDPDEYKSYGRLKLEDPDNNAWKKILSQVIPFRSKMLREKAKYRREMFKLMNGKAKEIFTKEEVEKISDVNRLNPAERWKLYYYWRKNYFDEILDQSKNFSAIYKGEEDSLRVVKDHMDYLLCKDKKIVGMTITGASKYKTLVELLAPKIILVEEAAEILESNIVAALSTKTEHLIMIGDHFQLRPLSSDYTISSQYKMEISLFERLVKSGVSMYTLINQHRMRPIIRQLITPHIYPELGDSDNVKEYPKVKYMAKNLFFFNHSHLEGSRLSSCFNKFEAEFIVELARYLLLRGVSPSSITILACYNAQKALILSYMKKYRKLFIKYTPEGLAFSVVKVSSVDGYQGDENDIILLSFVRSNQKHDIGFLHLHNRICVALSRARHALYGFGNFTAMAESSPMWEKIVNQLKSTNSIGTELVLSCECDMFKNSPYSKHTEPGQFAMLLDFLDNFCDCNKKKNDKLKLANNQYRYRSRES